MNLPYSLKKQVLYFFTLLLFISCSNEDQAPIITDNAVFVPQTSLISLTGDYNQLRLTWKPVVINNFISYKVYRYDSYTDANINPNVIVNLGQLIFQGSDNLNTVFEDNQVPFNSFIHYAVVTEYSNPDNDILNQNSLNFLSYENVNLSFEVTSLEKLADGSLKLTWETDTNVGFEKYTVAVVNDNNSYSSVDIFNNGAVINSIVNQANNTTEDARQYIKDKIYYAVSKVVNGKTIYSKNFLSIDNPRSLNFKPTQTFKNPYNDREIIIIDQNGAVVFYNLDSLSFTKINTNAQIFFCSIGTYNGVTDLYVPIEYGKVLVIDLVSHTVKETMNINSDTDYNIISAICINNHILFLEKHRYADIGGMFVYNRVNHNVINRNGSFSMSFNSKLVFAQENYFYFIWNDGLMHGSDSAIRRLNINGNNVTTDMLFNDTKADSRLFALSDDKSFFVSTNLGWQSNVDYASFTETTTQKYSQSQFFGDAKIYNNNEIYFALPNELRIEAFQKNNFSGYINQYPTTGIPLIIEIYSNQILSFNQFENYFYIQTIPK